MDAISGEIIWSYYTDTSIYSSPAVAGDQVIFGADKIYCLNTTNGASLWNYTTPGGSVAIAEDRVYVGSTDHAIYCLNVSTGEYLWSYTTGDVVHSSPIVAAGMLYVGSYDHKIYCLNASTGAFFWSFTTGNNVYSSPAIVHGKLYVGSDDHAIYCLPTILLPSAPLNLTASVGDTRLILSWEVPANDWDSAITNYRIYRGTSPGNETLFTTLGNTTTWTDSGLINGQNYYYRVSAENENGEGALSAESSAIPTPSISITGYLSNILVGLIASICIIYIIKQKRKFIH